VGGSAALIAFKWVAGLVMLLAMLDAMRSTVARVTPDARPHPLVVAGVLIVALAVISPGATFRPQLFTMSFLAVEMALLLRAERRWDAGARLPLEIAVLPPLFLVWANVHGGFLVGIGLFGVYCAVRIGDALLALVRRST